MCEILRPYLIFVLVTCAHNRGRDQEKMARRPEEGKQYTAERNALTKMNEDLCKALPIGDLLPKMISKGVIDFPDKAEIREERTDRNKVELFISKLTGEMDCGENKRFYKFLEGMEESSKCDFLVERMWRWINYYKGTPPPLRQTGKIIKSYMLDGVRHTS